MCRAGFEMNVAVAILRLYEGLDCSGILGDIGDVPTNKTFGDRFASRQKSRTYSISIDNSNLSGTFPSTPSTGSYKHGFHFVPFDNTSYFIITVSFELQEGESEHQPMGARQSVVFGVSTQKQSKKKQKQAITYRYINYFF